MTSLLPLKYHPRLVLQPVVDLFNRKNSHKSMVIGNQEEQVVK